jgi:hypothetical protein
VAKNYFGGSFAFSHGIIFRSLLATTSTGCALSSLADASAARFHSPIGFRH